MSEHANINSKGRHTDWKRIAAILFVTTGVVFHLSLIVRINDPRLQKQYFDVVNAPDPGPGVDFNALYVASQRVIQGKNLYTDLGQLLGAGQQQEIPGSTPAESSQKAKDYLPPFRYLPVASLVGVPISWMPFRYAYDTWIVFHELLFLMALFILYRSTRDVTLGLMMCGMLLWFAPYYVEIFQGQFSWPQAFLILLSIWQIDAGNVKGAMWAFIASVLWKLNTLLWVVPFALSGFRRWLLILLVAVIICSVPYFVMHPKDITSFIAFNFHPDTTHTFNFGNTGMRMFIDLYMRKAAFGLGGLMPAILVKYFSSIVALIILVLSLRAVIHNRGNLIGSMLVLITVYFLIYVDVWVHHWMMLLPVLIWEYRRSRNPLILLIWLLISVPVPFNWFGDYSVTWAVSPDKIGHTLVTFLYFGVKPLACLVFWWWQMKNLGTKRQ